MSSESKAATPEFTNMTWLENSKKHCDFPVSHVICFREVDVFFRVFREVGGKCWHWGGRPLRKGNIGNICLEINFKH